MLFVCYPKCTTCQKARAFLEERAIPYEFRDIKLDNPKKEELREWQHRSGLKPAEWEARFGKSGGNG